MIADPGKLEEPVCQVQTDGHVLQETTISLQAEDTISIDSIFESGQQPIIEGNDKKIESVRLAGRLRLFTDKWRKITTDKYILKAVNGYKIPFNKIPRQYYSPEQRKGSSDELRMIESEVEKMLEKNAIEKCKKSKDQFVSSFFLVPKHDGTKRFILNLKSLNKFIDPPHF